jgi:hypothetical protein
LFLWLAVAIVCVSLISAFRLVSAFRLGVERGFRDTIGNGNWGRVLFGVGTAITQVDHGGYGYALSTVIETVLTYGGLTDDPKILAPLGVQFPGKFTRSGTHQRGNRQGGEVRMAVQSGGSHPGQWG